MTRYSTLGTNSFYRATDGIIVPRGAMCSGPYYLCKNATLVVEVN